MSEMPATGRELLDVIETLGELEWAKFESRYPKVRVQGSETIEDRSAHPPFTSFRLKHEKPELTQALANAVASYVGDIPWVMIRHDRTPLPGVNWTICPKLVEELREEVGALQLPMWQYFAERRPSFGPMAYQDMLGLVRHVKDRLASSAI